MTTFPHFNARVSDGHAKALENGSATMVPKPLVACLAATALVSAAALMPVRASAASRGGPQPGTWNWPPYTEGATSGDRVRLCSWSQARAVGLPVPLAASVRFVSVTWESFGTARPRFINDGCECFFGRN
jgi:hypothetical protein